jgi:ParB/RepB/Spo0J family partition protein
MNNERPLQKKSRHADGHPQPPTGIASVGEITPAYLDASAFVPSAWTPDEFTQRTRDDELKASIQATGGNQTPVLVQRMASDEGKFEIVCGHRRVKACRDLGLAVLTHILNMPKSQKDVFFTQECENKNRRDFSCLEQALRFESVLKRGLFGSQDELAEFIGVSQPRISQVLPLAKLPKEVIHAFDDSRSLQPRHAKKLLPALETDSKTLFSKAAAFAKLRSANKTRTANETVSYLLDEVKDPADGWRLLIQEAPEVGKWKVSTDGETTVLISRQLSEAEIAAIAEIADKSTQTRDLVDNLVMTNPPASQYLLPA